LAPAALHGSLRLLLPLPLCWRRAWLLLLPLLLQLPQDPLTQRVRLCLSSLLLQLYCLLLVLVLLLLQLLRHRCCGDHYCAEQDLTCEHHRQRCLHQLVLELLQLGWPLAVLGLLLLLLRGQLLLCQHPLKLLHVLLIESLQEGCLQRLMQLQSCLTLQLCGWIWKPEAD
jgi:hypothetical protein